MIQPQMTPEELRDAISRGAEQPSVEFKAGGPRSEALLLCKVVTAMLAMANHRDGGLVILGVEETADAEGRKTLNPTGISREHRATWGADELADDLANYASPHIEFAISDCALDEGRCCLVIDVREFSDTPVLCKKSMSVKGKVLLKEGGCYVRPRQKPASVEVSTYPDMRDLLDLAADKALRQFVRRAHAAGVPLVPTQTDTDQFKQQLAGIELNEDDVLSKVKSRGYWSIIVRPTTFVAERVPDLDVLRAIVPRCQVRMRGWYFPYVDQGARIAIGSDWVSQSTDQGHHVGLWRLYQSGQFVDYCGLIDDWRDENPADSLPAKWRPGQWLCVEHVLFTFTQVFEFASRLALSEAASEQVVIHIGLKGMQGRSLWFASPSRGGFDGSGVSELPEFGRGVQFQRDKLVAEPREAAVQLARQFLQRFGWSAAPEILRDLQSELIGAGGN